MVTWGRNAQARLLAEERMTNKIEWMQMNNVWVSKEPVLPGVWRRKEGGHVVRGRATDSKTGKQKQVFRVFPDADAQTALKWPRDEQSRIRKGVDDSPERPRQRFAEFAASLFEHKIKVRDIKSGAGRNKWAFTLEHLIAGTTGPTSGQYVPGFGDYFVDKIETRDVERWKEGMAALVAAGDYAPTSVNTWLSVLSVVMKAAKRTFDLPTIVTDGVRFLDTSEHEVYTDEEPNALLPAEVPLFMARLRELFPQHYAMVHLGLITGLRPSTLRPLRRRGPECDVDWDEHRLRVRRSHTVGEEVMRTTKQRHRYTIGLPLEAMDVLRWHVDTQFRTPEQQASDLLFPGIDGGFRSTSVLLKPFAEVAQEVGLTKRITPRALRRTFNDLARAAQVQDVVTRSISGHLTEGMQRHYSTVSGDEQRRALARVIDLTKTLGAAAPPQGGQQPEQGGQHAGTSVAGGQQGGQQTEAGGQQSRPEDPISAGFSVGAAGIEPATSSV
jgi:integrase